MFVRQEAYYNAVPHGAKLTRAEQIERGKVVGIEKNSDDDSEDEVTTEDSLPIEVLERQEIPMPEISPGSEYLVAFLHSAGTATSTGMGLVGLSWQEIEAWAKCTDMNGIATPQDLRTVYMLSRVYANEYANASKKGAQPPWKPKVVLEAEVRELVSNKAEDLFAGLMSFQGQRKADQDQ